MKKTNSVVLALIMVLSLGCLPVWAASSVQVPWTVTDQTNGVTYTASYNASKKTLTYKTPLDTRFIDNHGYSEYDSSTPSNAIIRALSQRSQASARTLNEVLAFGDRFGALDLAFSEAVQSGKVNKVRIETPEGNFGYDNKMVTHIYEYSFKKNSKNQVTTCDIDTWEDNTMMGGNGATLNLKYDSNGGLKSIYDQYAHTPEHTTTFSYSNGKLNKLIVKSEVGGNHNDKVTTDNFGRPTKVTQEDTALSFTYDANGKVKSYTNKYNGSSDTITFNNNSNGYPESIVYLTVTPNGYFTTQIAFSYQTI